MTEFITGEFPDLPDIPRPEGCCPMCEQPGCGGAACAGCEQVQAEQPDDPGFTAKWLAEEPATRRRLLALRHGRDPWTGWPYRSAIQESASGEHGTTATYQPLHGAALVPRTAWDLG